MYNCIFVIWKLIAIMPVYRYFIFHKPYNVLSQFTKEVPSHITLQDFYSFPSDVYPVGRLDKDSEGLLILTNDNHLKHRLLDPSFQHRRTYWVQVENIPTKAALQQIREGIKIRIKKLPYFTKPAQVQLLKQEPLLPEQLALRDLAQGAVQEIDKKEIYRLTKIK